MMKETRYTKPAITKGDEVAACVTDVGFTALWTVERSFKKLIDGEELHVLSIVEKPGTGRWNFVED